MHYVLYGVGACVLVASLFLLRKLIKPNIDKEAQKTLNQYLKTLTNIGMGRFYERYIGHLYELDGYDVEYHGAINGYSDLGRDLIVRSVDEVLIVQTKCWAKYKLIQEKHIFQLFGTMTHFKRTSARSNQKVRAVIFTTARYSDFTRDIARVLGVELRVQDVVKSYPMIKCHLNQSGEKNYHLPFDTNYDKIKMNDRNQDCYVHTVQEAVDKGYHRAVSKKDSRLYVPPM